ncbi:MAG: TetR/AcrR family transcriptional regulator [Candidatus Limnocylindrales bacterium]
MTEPTTRRGRERKSAIVSAAAALMYERGVRATGLDEVLAAAGCGKSQLYHYFSSKDELGAAVLEHQLALVLGELSHFRLNTWSGIRAWFDALVEGQAERGFRGCLVGALAVEMSAAGGKSQQRVAEAFARWETTLAEGLEHMRQQGKLTSSARPAALAQATLASIQGGYLLSTAHHDIGPMRAALTAAYARLRSFA